MTAGARHPVGLARAAASVAGGRSRFPVFFSFVLLAILGATRAHPAPLRTGWYPAGGATWFIPLGTDVKTAYSGGPGVAGGIGYAWGRSLGAEVRLGWYRRDGSPEARLAESARSRLTLVPFSAEFLYRHKLSRTTDGAGGVGVFAAAGPALVFSREAFTYRYGGTELSTEGRRSDLAGTASAGFEGGAGESPLGWRLFARVFVAGGHRKVLRPGGRSDERSASATPSHAALGFELTWR